MCLGFGVVGLLCGKVCGGEEQSESDFPEIVEGCI